MMRGLSTTIFLACGLLLASTASGDRHHPRTEHRRGDLTKREGRLTQPEIDDEQDADYWRQAMDDDLVASQALITKRVPDHAKNVIVFLGDGMSVPTITAARIYKAQMEGNMDTPESAFLSFERQEHMGMSKPYAMDTQTGDSTSTASAMFTGVKTKYGTCGFDSHIEKGDPSSAQEEYEVENIFTWAQQAGMDTGVVTTARMTHATPAATYAHTFDRDYECDTKLDYVSPGADISDVPMMNQDIAWQMVNRSPGNKMKVLMGGGYPAYFPLEMAAELDQGYDEDWSECFRSDGQNLAQQWLDGRHAEGAAAEFVRNASALREVDLEATDYLFALLGFDHQQYEDAHVEGRDAPLRELATTAVKMLSKSGNGFVLLVEGGRIDHAHHDTWARRALSETVALDKAFEEVRALLEEMGELDDTLIIATADHSHTMSFSGYPLRGTRIIATNGEILDDDLPYTTLNYANGINFEAFYYVNASGQVARTDLDSAYTDEDMYDFEFAYPAASFRELETHGGDDVVIHASGPGAALFRSVHDQPYIANVMAFSACVGAYTDASGSDPICAARAGVRYIGDDEDSAAAVQVSKALLAAAAALLVFGNSL